MAPSLDDLLSDLAHEHRDLDAVVATLSASAWATPTWAENWSIADQISHLAFFDERAAMAMTDPDGFARDFEQMVAAGRDASVDRARSLTPAELLAAWRTARSTLIDAARAADPTARVPWYGPAMSLRSCVTARLMETWAHGQDVVDVLGIDRAGTARLRHVAHIAVGARAYALMVNRMTPDDRPVFVELSSPTGDTLTWGSPDAEGGSVRGAALEFCLVAIQRRHLLDTALRVDGDAATQWMSVVQAFAGPAGPGRDPLRGRRSS
ncbi:MAG: TIGR03084 family protein [Acidimicrobiales bacterium mtb01]|nr:TIGR03084 family protein [Actinomycetota bacterium]TEX45644.1 MAG: TIGR03084 family protein [Acidimicrobiales bacterium mtb01]